MDRQALELGWKSRAFGLWRYRELIPLGSGIVTLHEGGTPIYKAERAAAWAGVREVHVKYEGANPTASFKDRGMSVGLSKAVQLGKKMVLCASTGNTAASMSAYAAAAGLEAYVLIPKGQVAAGKLFQTMLYGGRLITVRGNFDDALDSVLSISDLPGTYILNSVNAWRIEGQKTLAFELWEQMEGEDYFVSVPVGNCGNIAAVWKGFKELRSIGLIERTPRLIGVQAEGASPFVDLVQKGYRSLHPVERPTTIASAIRIGKPVNWLKALRAVWESDGLVVKVSDEEILEAARVLAAREGIGVEPASAASLAGVRHLRIEGALPRDARVVCVATGSALKDPNPDLLQGVRVVEAEPEAESIAEAMRLYAERK